ncbi:hypothetical protein J6TS2_16370 [Heyndrickxia sporothermodurans]|nr:hypothetical protein J6TS2_16370 [Heyndrickxia sporothermodurans]
MKFSYLDKDYELENNISILNEFLIQMNANFQKQGRIIKTIMIDGIEINQEFEQYVINNIQKINHIEILDVDLKVFLNEVIIEAIQYLQNALPELEKLHEEFYSEITASTWEKFNFFLEGGQWILQVVQVLIEQVQMKEIEEIQGKLTSILEEMLSALENQDTTLIGDLLSYEISPIYEEILSLLKQKEGSVK